MRTGGDAERELERVVSRMKQIQRDIARSSQPPSVMQIEELKQLGTEYGRIIERLADPPAGTTTA